MHVVSSLDMQLLHEFSYTKLVDKEKTSFHFHMQLLIKYTTYERRWVSQGEMAEPGFCNKN